MAARISGRGRLRLLRKRFDEWRVFGGPSYKNFVELYRRSGGELEKSEKEIRSEWQGLLYQAKRRIKVLSDEIRIPLGAIESRDPWTGKSFSIGKFVVVLLPREFSAIKFVALNRRRAVRHEHIFYDDSRKVWACLGNFANPLRELVGSKEFLLAVHLAREFLETGERS